MKDCPNCNLTNPDNALICDCGYKFLESKNFMQNIDDKDNLVPAEKYAEEIGLNSNEVIQMIRDAKLVGVIEEGKWYVNLQRTNILSKQGAREKGFSGEELILGPSVKNILGSLLFVNSIGVIIEGCLLDDYLRIVFIMIAIFGVLINIFMLMSLIPSRNCLKINDEGFTIHHWSSIKKFNWSDITTIEVKRLYIPPFTKSIWFFFTDSYWNNVGRGRPRSLGLGEMVLPTFLMSMEPEKMLEIFNEWKNEKSIDNGHKEDLINGFMRHIHIHNKTIFEETQGLSDYEKLTEEKLDVRNELSDENKAKRLAMNYYINHDCVNFYSEKFSSVKNNEAECRVEDIGNRTYLIHFRIYKKSDEELYSFEVDLNTGIVCDIWADSYLRKIYGDF